MLGVGILSSMAHADGSPTVDGLRLRVDELLLRPWEGADVDAVLAACQDAGIQRWTRVPSPYTRRDAEQFVLESAPHELASGQGIPLGVFAAGSGRLLGAVGLHGLRATVDPELGWWLAPTARGHGVATRAVRALVVAALRDHALPRVTAWIDVVNVASRRVAERAGLRFEGVARQGLVLQGRRADWAVYAAVRADLDGLSG